MSDKKTIVKGDEDLGGAGSQAEDAASECSSEQFTLIEGPEEAALPSRFQESRLKPDHNSNSLANGFSEEDLDNKSEGDLIDMLLDQVG